MKEWQPIETAPKNSDGFIGVQTRPYLLYSVCTSYEGEIECPDAGYVSPNISHWISFDALPPPPRID